MLLFWCWCIANFHYEFLILLVVYSRITDNQKHKKGFIKNDQEFYSIILHYLQYIFTSFTLSLITAIFIHSSCQLASSGPLQD